MKHRARWFGGIPILLLVSLASAVVAPIAEARPGHGNAWGRRYKDESCAYRGYRGGYGDTRVVYRDRGSSAGPAIAGFIGGLVVGSVLNNGYHRDGYHRDGYYRDDCPPRTVVRERVIVHERCAPSYRYYDPYCGASYNSLDSYYQHASCHHHPYVARVIDVRSDRCVDTACYQDGRWSRGYGPDYACDDRGDDDDWDN